MKLDANKALVQHWLELWNRHALDELGALVTDDYMHHASSGADIPFAGFRQGFAGILRAFPDAHYAVVHIVAEGDLVAVYLKADATQQGKLFGIEPGGKRISMSGVYHCRIRDGRICEDWDIFDMLNAAFTLGAKLQAG